MVCMCLHGMHVFTCFAWQARLHIYMVLTCLHDIHVYTVYMMLHTYTVYMFT